VTHQSLATLGMSATGDNGTLRHGITLSVASEGPTGTLRHHITAATGDSVTQTLRGIPDHPGRGAQRWVGQRQSATSGMSSPSWRV
jgi:hypothetical protein